jgi:hypothetical protein
MSAEETQLAGDVRCKKLACTVSENGECYEGLSDPGTCPNYANFTSEFEEAEQELSDSVEEDSVDLLTPPLLETLDLYGGDELDHKGSLQITLNSLTRVIVLAGPNDSGKTTLLASLFESFFTNALASYLFCHCETLRAFDRRCHLSRTDSEMSTEDTERTKSDSEEAMLHLRVRHDDLLRPPQDLLVSDIRGELFKKAIRTQAEAQRIRVLKRADHLALLVDGEKIASLSSRNQVSVAAGMTLRSFIEGGMIGRQTLVEVLFTKDDLIRVTEQEHATREFLEVFERDLRERYESELGGLRFYRIAARAKEGVASYGLPEVFRVWVEESMYRLIPSTSHQRIVTSERDFDQFGWRQSPHRYVVGKQN